MNEDNVLLLKTKLAGAAADAAQLAGLIQAGAIAGVPDEELTDLLALLRSTVADANVIAGQLVGAGPAVNPG